LVEDSQPAAIPLKSLDAHFAKEYRVERLRQCL
jgi:hypothetical protein